MLPEIAQRYIDKMGIGVSLLCAVHCAMLPLIITMLPLLGLEVFADPLFETAIIFTSLIIGITSLSSAFVQHKARLPLLLLVTGFISIFIGHYFIGENFEWLFLASGGFTVAAAHYNNWQLIKQCSVSTIDA
jgi:hypothetical protein